MKVAIIFYHSHILENYKYSYITQFLKSLKNQTSQDFHIFELNYDDRNDLSIMDKTKIFPKSRYTFLSKSLKNHIEAQNFLFKYCFDIKDYDIVMNTNIDDYYHSDKLRKQVNFMKKHKIDIISSSFNLFQEVNGKLIQQEVKMIETDDIDEQNNFLMAKFSKNDSRSFQNSGSCITKKFYLNNNKVVYENFPLLEVLFMCKNSIKKNTFYIIPEVLTYQRIHNNQISYKHR